MLFQNCISMTISIIFASVVAVKSEKVKILKDVDFIFTFRNKRYGRLPMLFSFRNKP